MNINMFELSTYLKDKTGDMAPELFNLTCAMLNSPVVSRQALVRVCPIAIAKLDSYLQYFVDKNYIEQDTITGNFRTDGLELLMSRAESYYYTLPEDKPISVF